jgi:hypothetical protein
MCGVSEGVEFSVKCGEREVSSRWTVAIYVAFPYITSYCMLVRQFALHDRAVRRGLDADVTICWLRSTASGSEKENKSKYISETGS